MLFRSNTEGLIGGIARVLNDEGVELVDSTLLLKDLLATEGTLTRRKLTADEAKDIQYGRKVASTLAGIDVGQSVAIAERACVAVEAMEGTDATISRAGELFRTLDSGGETTLRRALTVVKVAKPNQDMRFDVPVVGVATIEAMKAAGATCLAVEAERTLMFDPAAILNTADAAGISIVAK